jgi:hypothetical protein
MTKSGRLASNVAGLALAAGCGTNVGDGPRIVGSGRDDAGEMRDVVADAAGDDGASLTFSGDGSSGTPSGATCTPCSSDLHQVLDCATGEVVATCPADKAVWRKRAMCRPLRGGGGPPEQRRL